MKIDSDKERKNLLTSLAFFSKEKKETSTRSLSDPEGESGESSTNSVFDVTAEDIKKIDNINPSDYKLPSEISIKISFEPEKNDKFQDIKVSFKEGSIEKNDEKMSYSYQVILSKGEKKSELKITYFFQNKNSNGGDATNDNLDRINIEKFTEADIKEWDGINITSTVRPSAGGLPDKPTFTLPNSHQGLSNFKVEIVGVASKDDDLGTYKYLVEVKNTDETVSKKIEVVYVGFLARKPYYDIFQANLQSGLIYEKYGKKRIYTYGSQNPGASRDKGNPPVEMSDARNFSIIKQKGVLDFSGDENNEFFITKDNKLFVTGKNLKGQLGLGHANQTNSYIEITDPNIQNKAKYVVNQLDSTSVVTTDGNLFVTGLNDEGQLGLGNKVDQNRFVEITDANIKGKVKSVTKGAYHTLVVTTDDNLFVTGLNDEGQLGLGNNINQNRFVEVTNANIKGKVKFAMAKEYQSLVVTTENKLFVVGTNSNGRIGLGSELDLVHTPKTNRFVEITNGNIQGKVKSAVMSDYNLFVLTTEDKLFVTGGNESGQLGLGPTFTADRLGFFTEELTALRGKLFSVFLGKNSALFLTTSNQILAVGLFWETGLRGTTNAKIPTRVFLPND